LSEIVYARGFGAFADTPGATLIDQSVRKLRNAIMSGELLPGQKLVEAKLGRDLDISRASLREALRVLEAERLIQLLPNRGPSVAKLNYDDIVEIHDVWAMLTGEALYNFTELAGAEDLSQLDGVLKRLNDSITVGASLDQLEAINAFFAIVMAKCGNRVLAETVFGLLSRVNFLRAQAILRPGWAALFAKEMAEIVAAVRSRSPDASRAATRRHIDSACAAAKQIVLMSEPEPVRRGRRNAAGQDAKTPGARAHSGLSGRAAR